MDEVALGSVIAFWLATAVEIYRTSRGDGSRPLTVVLATLSIGRTLDLDPVLEFFGRSVVVGVMEHVFELVAAAAMVAFLRSLFPESATHHAFVFELVANRWAQVVALAALVLPLVHYGEVLPADSDARAAVYASSWAWGVHWGASLAVLCITLGYGALISLRSARYSPRVLRARLLLIGAGHLSGVLYGALKAARLVAIAVDPDFAARDETLAAVEQVLLAFCMAAIATGVAAGPGKAALESLRVRFRVWSLWPLWVGLWDHAPHLPFSDPPRRLAAVASRDARMILVRQVVELGDATRALAPHMPRHVADDPAEVARALAVAAARRAGGAEPLWLAADRASQVATVEEQIARLRPVARRWSRRHTRLAHTRLAHTRARADANVRV